MRRTPKYRSKIPVELESRTNLVPILSIVLVVILMLLVAVEFEQIGVLDVGKPPSCGCVLDPDPTPTTVIVVDIGLHGFEMAVDGESVGAQTLAEEIGLKANPGSGWSGPADPVGSGDAGDGRSRG